MKSIELIRRNAFTFFLALGGAFLLTVTVAFGAPAEKTFRVGYYQAGDYWTSRLTFEAFKNSLFERGWTDRVNFVPDANYSPGWDAPQEEHDRAARALMARNDLDLIIVMGTSATRTLLAENNKKTPILGLDITDPVKAHLVKSPSDSGIDNFTTLIQKDLWNDMLHLFHKSTNFKVLGMVDIDGSDGQIFSNLGVAREVSRDRGFKLIIFESLSFNSTAKVCQGAIDNLIEQGIDAFFLPILPCFDLGNAKALIERLNEHKIATFASEGSLLIKYGALMGASTHNLETLGRKYADMAIEILDKKVPARDLPMQYRIPPSVAMNLETAERIGVYFSTEMLAISDEIYLKTER